MTSEPALKRQVQNYWNADPCDSRFGKSGDPSVYFDQIERKRYQLEPFIEAFADFPSGKGKRILEIGVGLGSDFLQWVKGNGSAIGIDLTWRGVRLTQKRLDLRGITRRDYGLLQADAEHLPFRDRLFHVVYSWGVFHHTPESETAFKESFRVLAPGGILKAMVYHVPSWTGWLLWFRYGLLAGKPSSPVKELISQYLESPGTQAYTSAELHRLLHGIGFRDILSEVKLGPSDLLKMELGNKYRSMIYQILRFIYPRRLIKSLGHGYGLLLLIRAMKPESTSDTSSVTFS